jgi:integrase/recombinase XerD
VQSLRVALSDTLAYWTVVDDDWCPVLVADTYLRHLRHLRLGAGRAEGTTRSYAGDLACYLSWCEQTGRDLLGGVKALSMFVAMLKTTPVARAGAGQGRPRSSRRINHLLAVVRELYKHAVADGTIDARVLALLYEVGDDRYLPAELKPEGSGLRYRARPRHVQRSERPGRPVAVRQDEVEALLRASRSWRDRFLLVLLWFCGLRIGEALGLRRSDLHFASSASVLGCSIPGPHLHVVDRGNSNGARAKSGKRAVPVRAEILAFYDRYLAEREACPAGEACDFVLVNLYHEPIGRPMSADTVRKWLAGLSGRAGLERTLVPHMFRHATANELLRRGAAIDVVKELLGHASIETTQMYLNPDADALREAVDSLGPLGGEALQ